MKRLVLLLAACGSAAPAPVAPPSTDHAEAVFGDPAWRMLGSVDFIGFSGDDFVVASDTGNVALFTRKGERTIVREGRDRSLDDFALVGDRLVLASTQSRVVDIRTRAEKPYEIATPIESLVTDGKVAVVDGDDKKGPLRVIDLATGVELRTLQHSRGYSADSLKNGRVVGSRSGTIAIWDLASGTRHRVYGRASPYAVSRDTTYLATGAYHDDQARNVDIYRVEDGHRTAMIDARCDPADMVFSPDGTQLAWACDDAIRVVSIPDGRTIVELPSTRTYLRTLVWSPDGDVLATGGNDNVLHAWDTITWKPLTRVIGSRGEVRQIAVSEPYLITHAWGDHSAWLWVTDRVKPALELGGADREIYGVATDGRSLALAVRTPDKMSIEWWEGARRVHAVEAPPNRFGSWPLIREVGLLPDGRAWFTAEGSLRVIGRDGRETWRSARPVDDEFPDGHAAATRDGRAAVIYTGHVLEAYDLVEGKALSRTELRNCSSAEPAIDPTGKRAALVNELGIRIIDIHAGKVVATLHHTSEDAERGIAWRSSDEVLAYIGDDLVAWTVGAPTAAVMPVAGSRSIALDGDLVYLGRSDGTVLRRSLTSLRVTARQKPVSPITACPTDDGYETFGFGRSGYGQRGRLDDSKPWDD